MELTPVQRRLVNAFAILIMAERRMYDDAPQELHEEIKIRIAEIEIEKLS